jgi:5-methyltetrahydrofolate--homocysteine methyltransferase
MMENYLDQIKTLVIGGKHKEIESLVRRAIRDGVDLDGIVNQALIPAMDVVGKRFEEGAIFVPEMLVSAVTMKKALSLIKPLLSGSQTESKGTILMGTVKGDLHDIGKNLVIMMLEGAGFQVIDLGVDTSVEKVVEQVREVSPQILGLSALLTTTMPEMKRAIEVLEAEGLRQSLKVMVGGAPIDAKFAEKIGADGYGKDAAEAVQLARRLAAKS